MAAEARFRRPSGSRYPDGEQYYEGELPDRGELEAPCVARTVERTITGRRRAAAGKSPRGVPQPEHFGMNTDGDFLRLAFRFYGLE